MKRAKRVADRPAGTREALPGTLIALRLLRTMCRAQALQFFETGTARRGGCPYKENH